MPSPVPPPPSDTLLLCVDLQPKFVGAMAGGDRIIRRCTFALAAATGLGLPAAFTEQVPEKLGATDPATRAAAPSAPVWVKTAFSVFGDDVIRAELLRRDVQHLVLCGIETPVCIYQSALDARAEGLEVTLLSDAIGARRPADAAVCLEALARAGVHVLPSETVFYALLRDARHPFFRTYTQLVKNAGESPA